MSIYRLAVVTVACDSLPHLFVWHSWLLRGSSNRAAGCSMSSWPSLFGIFEDAGQEMDDLMKLGLIPSESVMVRSHATVGAPRIRGHINFGGSVGHSNNYETTYPWPPQAIGHRHSLIS